MTKQKHHEFTNIDSQKPLTTREETFCYEYIKLKDATKAAIAAGFSHRSAAVTGHRLVHSKPNTRRFIQTLLSRYFERLNLTAFDLIQNIVHIALTSASELMYIENGRVRFKDTASLTPEALALYAGAKERINERGDISVEIKTHDQMAAKKLLLDYLKLMKDSRGPIHPPHIEQINAIEAIQAGKKTVIEAALDLDRRGVPLPDTVKILLNKQAIQEEEDDTTGMVIPTPEEMEERRRRKLAEIEDQKETFLPKRQEEIRMLKKETGDRIGRWE